MKLIQFIANFFRIGNSESSMRLIFIITALTTLTGLLFIDIKFAMHIIKYTGVEIAAVIGANSLFLGSVIYGKNKAKTIENDGKLINSKINSIDNTDDSTKTNKESDK